MAMMIAAGTAAAQTPSVPNTAAASIARDVTEQLAADVPDVEIVITVQKRAERIKDVRI